MGGKSSSSSSQATTNNDNRFVAGGDAVVAHEGAAVTVTDFDVLGQTVSSVVELAQSVITGVADAGQSYVDQVSGAQQSALDFANNSTKPDESNVIKSLTPILLGGVALWILKGSK